MSFPTISRLNTPQLVAPLTLRPEFDPRLDPFYLPEFKLDEFEFSFKKKPLTLFPEGECQLKLDLPAPPPFSTRQMHFYFERGRMQPSA